MIRILSMAGIGILALCLSAQPRNAPQPLTADAIMARVAANQDHAVAERAASPHAASRKPSRHPENPYRNVTNLLLF